MDKLLSIPETPIQHHHYTEEGHCHTNPAWQGLGEAYSLADCRFEP